MSGGGFVVTVFLLVLGVAWLALPFLIRKAGVDYEAGDKGRDRLNLASAYERALLMVRDLDEDYQLGKIPPETYAVERTRLVEQGASLLEALEKAGGTPKKGKRGKRGDQVVTPTPAPASDLDPVEQAIAAYTRAREQAQER